MSWDIKATYHPPYALSDQKVANESWSAAIELLANGDHPTCKPGSVRPVDPPKLRWWQRLLGGQSLVDRLAMALETARYERDAALAKLSAEQARRREDQRALGDKASEVYRLRGEKHKQAYEYGELMRKLVAADTDICRLQTELTTAIADRDEARMAGRTVEVPVVTHHATERPGHTYTTIDEAVPEGILSAVDGLIIKAIVVAGRSTAYLVINETDDFRYVIAGGGRYTIRPRSEQRFHVMPSFASTPAFGPWAEDKT